jgi:hypothetical protein
MRHSIGLTLMIGIATGALMMVAGDRGNSQSIDPNAAPNPYRMLDSWAQLPADRKFGGVIKVQVDHRTARACGCSTVAGRPNAPTRRWHRS